MSSSRSTVDKNRIKIEQTIKKIKYKILKKRKKKNFHNRQTMATDTRRRVKLYALNADRQWDDRGTGHVTSNYVDRLKGIFY